VLALALALALALLRKHPNGWGKRGSTPTNPPWRIEYLDLLENWKSAMCNQDFVGGKKKTGC
jgi:hypothetical protein